VLSLSNINTEANTVRELTELPYTVVNLVMRQKEVKCANG